MTNKKFIAYNLMATGLFIILIAFSDFFFPKNELLKTQNINEYDVPVNFAKQPEVTATERENITFILGEDEKPEENYYASATQFYRTHPTEKTEQLITSCRSILEVRDYLATHFQSGQMPWGKINLVVHGNEWSGLGVATLPGGKRTTVASIKSAIENNKLRPLPEFIADDCTEIHIHGCAVGRNVELLKTIGKAFGASQPVPVKSSVHFIRYEPTEGRPCRSQLESYYAFYPKTYRPTDQELIAQLKKRYPQVEINWEDALSRRQPRHQKDIYHHTFNVPIVWTVAYADEKSVPNLAKWSAQRKWLREQNELQDLLEEYKMPLENFQWTFLNTMHELEDGTKVPAIRAIGLCTVLTILKPVEGSEI